MGKCFKYQLFPENNKKGEYRLCHTGAKNRQRKIVTKFVIRCVCHTEGLKSWQIIKKMTHENLKIVKKLVHVPDI